MRIAVLVIILSLTIITAVATNAVAQEAVVESDNVTISESGTGQTVITVNATAGLSIANIEISVDTSVAEITSVESGADVNSDNAAVNFNTINQSSDSARIEYANISSEDSTLNGFELAVVEFESVSRGDTPIRVTENGIFNSNNSEYNDVEVLDGRLNSGSADDSSGSSNNSGQEESNSQENLPGFTPLTALLAMFFIVMTKLS